jgi:hypothetical protein
LVIDGAHGRLKLKRPPARKAEDKAITI